MITEYIDEVFNKAQWQLQQDSGAFIRKSLDVLTGQSRLYSNKFC